MNAIEPWNIPNTKLGAGAVILRDDEVVLVKINHGPAKGKWILPGGRVESGESLLTAVKREAKEECGLSVVVEGVLAFRQRVVENQVMDVYFLFLCHHDPHYKHEKLRADDPNEILEVKYWKIKEALNSPEVRPVTQEAIRLASSDKPLFKFRENVTGFPETDFLFS